MKSIIAGIILLGLLLSGCSQITSYEECVAAGYPIMESDPQKCAAQGNVFIEGETPIAEESDDEWLAASPCLATERDREVCAQVVDPVCGWSEDNSNANTYNNRCEACIDENVAYTTEGLCPSN